MDDLHGFHLCLSHGWAEDEARHFHNPSTYYKPPRKAAVPKFTPAKDLASEPVIPDAALFKPLPAPPSANLDTGFPRVSECATHLELLEAIYQLRREVISTTRLDEALGLGPATRKVWRKKVVRGRYMHVQVPILDSTYPQRSKQKWPLFLALAACRFEIWAVAIEALMARPGNAEAILPHLPPLDVLAVWHAFLLNPSAYRAYCKERELEHLALVPFPWDRIHTSIQSKSAYVSFEISPAEAHWFEKATQQPVSLLEAMESASRRRGGPASEALLSYGREDSKRLRSVNGILHQMSKYDRDYNFVLFLAEAEKASGHVLSLTDNVVRQGSFVDKMNAHLWLRSPAVEGTIRRAIDRYDKLTQLFRDYPGQTLVPTPDMDLAWHTHQLSHMRYRTGIQAITGRFIDHNDKLGQGTLNAQEDETRRIFEDVFDEEYSRCMCWDCEAILSAADADDEMSIWGSDGLEALATHVRGEVQYYRAVEVERRRGWPSTQKRVIPLPTRRGALS